MADVIREGLGTGLGFAMAIVLILGVGRIVMEVIDRVKSEIDKLKKRPKFVLDNWETYVHKGYFEELAIFSKYKKQLEKGEWPDELEGMFEWVDTGKAAKTDGFGDMYFYKKSFLTLKSKYKNKEAGKSKDEKSNKKTDTDNSGNNEEKKDEETK